MRGARALKAGRRPGASGGKAMSQSSGRVNRGDSAEGYHGWPSLGFPGAKSAVIRPLRNTLFILETAKLLKWRLQNIP